MVYCPIKLPGIFLKACHLSPGTKIQTVFGHLLIEVPDYHVHISSSDEYAV